MARIGYIRVSSIGQNTDRQESNLDKMNLDKIFSEKVSGKNADRPELMRMMEWVREGDTVIVDSISRFSRNVRDLLNLVDQLTEKGVAFVSLKENIDTELPQGRFVLTLFGALAELEREQILERQREGIECAKKKDAELKAAGLPAVSYKGRKRLDDAAFTDAYRRWKNEEITGREAASMSGMSAPTFYRRVRELESGK